MSIDQVKVRRNTTKKAKGGMNISVMKQEKVKLWGMFKMKTKMMKILLVQREGEDFNSKGV